MPSPKLHGCSAASPVIGVVYENHLGDDAIVAGQVEYSTLAAPSDVLSHIEHLLLTVSVVNHDAIEVNGAMLHAKLKGFEAAFPSSDHDDITIHAEVDLLCSEQFPATRLVNRMMGRSCRDHKSKEKQQRKEAGDECCGVHLLDVEK